MESPKKNTSGFPSTKVIPARSADGSLSREGLMLTMTTPRLAGSLCAVYFVRADTVDAIDFSEEWIEFTGYVKPSGIWNFLRPRRF